MTVIGIYCQWQIIANASGHGTTIRHTHVSMNDWHPSIDESLPNFYAKFAFTSRAALALARLVLQTFLEIYWCLYINKCSLVSEIIKISWISTLNKKRLNHPLSYSYYRQALCVHVAALTVFQPLTTIIHWAQLVPFLVDLFEHI